jgi:hypothetical protein
LPPQSIGTWKDLEQKFHAHYFSGSTEKKLIDLATLKQRHNETPLEFLRRFREVKGMCFSLAVPDDQLADMAVAGMLLAIREKLFGMEFDNLGQLSQKLLLMSNQAYGFKKDVGEVGLRKHRPRLAALVTLALGLHTASVSRTKPAAARAPTRTLMPLMSLEFRCAGMIPRGGANLR